jgi:electron transfer flavoprotein alpha subunit
LVAAPDGAAHVAVLAAHGADRVLVAEDSRLSRATEPHASLICSVVESEKPGVVLFPATVWGRDVAPRVAGRLGLGLTGECVDLSIDEKGRLLQHKPAFGGSVVALIASRTMPEMATVRPGMLAAAQPDFDRRAEIVEVAVPEVAQRVRVVETQHTARAVADLEGAEVVVGFGMGIGSADNLRQIEELAEVVGGALCTTRDVTDAGWVPKQYQVGMTGRVIAPQLYFAVALRGAFEHTVGTRRSGLIVAINRSARAPIFKSADFGIVGDWKAVVPLLIEKLRERKTLATDEHR